MDVYYVRRALSSSDLSPLQQPLFPESRVVVAVRASPAALFLLLSLLIRNLLEFARPVGMCLSGDLSLPFL